MFTGNIKPQLGVGEECSITLHKAEAGTGNVTCHVVNTSTSTVLKTTVIDNHDGTVTVKYVPTVAGSYTTDIKFGGVTIPAGRITQQVCLTDCLSTVISDYLLSELIHLNQSVCLPTFHCRHSVRNRWLAF